VKGRPARSTTSEVAVKAAVFERSELIVMQTFYRLPVRESKGRQGKNDHGFIEGTEREKGQPPGQIGVDERKGKDRGAD